MVALKRVRPGQLGSRTARQRFSHEAKTAAQLDHPGIVPVFEVGEVEEAPYFTMALLSGASLRSLMDTGPTPPQEAARYTQQVADALTYAHQQGIVHGDVKPSNVLLDNTGRPRLIDFGAAREWKAVDNASDGVESAEIESNEVMEGSPSYMAPEQAAGDRQHITPVTDVYGLGALLYGLLAARPPFQAASPEETLRQVHEVSPLALTELDPTIPTDLETITQKALEKSPNQRYASVQEMAEDLQRFLAGRPILARPVGGLERATRWAWRNPALAATIALMILTVAVLGFSARQVVNQRSVARANLVMANEQRSVAETNLQLAVEAVDEFFTQVSQDTLLNEPGMRPLRKSLLESARRFYDEMAAKQPGTEASQMLHVDAILRQARIVELIESTPAARELFEQAIETIEEIEGYDQRAEWLTKLGEAKSAQAAMILDMGELAGARDVLHASDALFRKALSLNPDSMPARLGRATLLRRFCTYHSRSGQLKECLPLSDEAEAILSDLVSQKPGLNPEVLKSLANAQRTGGVVRLLLGQHDASLQKLEAAIRTWQQHPQAEMTDARWSIAELQTIQARSLARTQRLQEAADLLGTAIEILKSLSNQFPLTDRFTAELANAYQQLGGLCWSRHDFPGALQHYQLALTAFEQLAAKRPLVVEHRVSVGRAHQNIGIAYEYMRDASHAEASYQEAVHTFTSLVERNPDQPRLKSDLVRLSANLGTSRMHQGKWDLAEASLAAALSMAQQVYAAHPQLIESAIAVGEAAMALGDCLLWTGRERASLATFDQGIEAAQEHLSGQDDHAALVRAAHSCWFRKGEAFYQLREWEPAAEAFRQAMTLSANDDDRAMVDSYLQMIRAHRGEYQEVAASLEIPMDDATVDATEFARLRLFVLGSCYQATLEDASLGQPEREPLLTNYKQAALQALQELVARDGLTSFMERREFLRLPAFEGLLQDADFIAALPFDPSP